MALLLLLSCGVGDAWAQGSGSLTPGRTFRDCAGCPEMVVVPPGRFMMGTKPAETAREDEPDEYAAWERPRHAVAVRSAFAVGKYPVTRGEYAQFVQMSGYDRGDTSWQAPEAVDKAGSPYVLPQTDRDPVVNVSWDDAKAYVAWLSRTTGKTYRLLTEAEWEYAARAGTTTAAYWGNEKGQGHANCGGCGSRWDDKGTSPVGSFPPNAFGLYDMLGNVYQRVEDCWRENYAQAPADASVAVESGDCGRRVVRGGSWGRNPWGVRAGSRLGQDPGDRDILTGFRVARTE